MLTPEAEKKLHAKLDDALKGLTNELGKRGVPHQLVEPDPIHGHRPLWRKFNSIGGEYMEVEIKAERGSPMARAKGKIRIQVGNYGERRQFPERKDGFNFAAIVDCIQTSIKAKKEGRKADKEKDKLKKAMDDAHARISEQVGDVPDTRLSVNPRLDGFDIELSGLDEEKTLKVLTSLKEILS